MRILVATDAWHPQVNGVVRTYERLVLEAGADLEDSWRSLVFDEKHPIPLVRIHRRCELPVRLHAWIELSP